ncbi:MAG TPA: SMC-Scp complex subunit ScpB [Marinagarivorans sp.]
MSDTSSPELVEESPVESTPAVEEGDYHYDPRFLSRVLEGAILASGEALSLDKLLTLFDEDKRPSKRLLLETLESIQQAQHDRGFILKQVASGWRFEVCDDLAPWVNRLWEERPQKYSRALLETIALIAYRQPLTRGDIEDVRGVAVSSNIIKTLVERDWVKVVGHRDVPGRPALYATTRQFLDYFGLKSLDELPSLGELKDIDSLSEKLELEGNAVEAEDDCSANDSSNSDSDASNNAEQPEAQLTDSLDAHSPAAAADAEGPEQTNHSQSSLAFDADQPDNTSAEQTPREQPGELAKVDSAMVNANEGRATAPVTGRDDTNDACAPDAISQDDDETILSAADSTEPPKNTEV